MCRHPSAEGSEWKLIAPCGLYCGECTAFLNGECSGCRAGVGLAKEYRRLCKIAKCSERKGIQVCIDCDEFHVGSLSSSSLRI